MFEVCLIKKYPVKCQYTLNINCRILKLWNKWNYRSTYLKYLSFPLNRIQLLVPSIYNNFSEHKCKMKFIKSFYSTRRAILLFFLTLWSVMRLYYSGLLETAVRIIRFQRFVDDCRRIGDNDSRIEFNCAGNDTSHVYIFPYRATTIKAQSLRTTDSFHLRRKTSTRALLRRNNRNVSALIDVRESLRKYRSGYFRVATIIISLVDKRASPSHPWRTRGAFYDREYHSSGARNWLNRILSFFFENNGVVHLFAELYFFSKKQSSLPLAAHY